MSVLEQAAAARVAAIDLAAATRAEKDRALLLMADRLVERTDDIVAANAVDIANGRENGIGEAMIDRLTLTPDRVAAMADGLRQLAALPDPIGDVVRGSTLANGLELRQVRVPFGVVGMIYEGRPNVTADAAGICLKSGNAALLRGSGSAFSSNAAIVSVLRKAVTDAGLPANAIQLLDATTRDSVKELMRARGLVDVLIPRGGASLIKTVVEQSTVPVIETGVGNCHVYVDAAADLEKALAVTVNSKTQRLSTCNTAESLLVHAEIADSFLPLVLEEFALKGVTVHGDARVAGHSDDVVAATEEDWGTEYLSADISVGVVDSLEDALDHIRQHGTGHTEAIVSESVTATRRFVAGVDAAAVMVNASTRFTDGGEFGFGAEIGISTQKLHARGPMGLPELTSTKYVVTGNGHTR
ncbi:putative gamma-glutamyl phosphate reductase [Actinoplanes missouriensis 431]|uniref:Gamma-glutamyl phosphate reductase n=1 Tax=Actinoplanes missouriensis (strain ATCC 14538 / DSM 43046 / CBS 188.64 / JCM 3121 / NBRC 102363 / NCIMB 12654 / NRRL B-3342 / UNCC 431) TaxID=512565 RepID=I0GYD0_ACTM4|nr:glutamate-5-semialdehyde dehydrogenase [Actinoplanes missouriensis]BAL85767.1 putative gamma-glutamyl phosphate reductase [Actinoplanes missouriensis 431]